VKDKQFSCWKENQRVKAARKKLIWRKR